MIKFDRIKNINNMPYIIGHATSLRVILRNELFIRN